MKRLLLLFVIFLTGCTQTYKIQNKNTEIILTLSASDGSYDAGLLPNYGHSFVVLTNNSNQKLLFMDFIIEPKNSISFSIWPISDANTVWFNLELYYLESSLKYSDTLYVSRKIDINDLLLIENFINQSPKWSVFYNCTTFSIDVWNLVSDQNSKININSTPKNLKKTISIFTNFESKLNFISDENYIGFYDHGEFLNCVVV